MIAKSALQLCLLAFAASPVVAQDTATQNKLVQFGGSMHALATACGQPSSNLAQMKRDQKSRAMAAGMSSAEYERLFQSSCNNAQGRLAKATPAEKAKACAQVAAAGARH